MSTDEKTPTTDDGNNSDSKAIIEKLKRDVKHFNNRAKELEKLIVQRESEDALEEQQLEEWHPVQTKYVANYLNKCTLRMNLHEDSARYYNHRHYWISIPATIMGAVSSTTAFTQWSGNVLCGEANIMWLVVGVIMVTTTVLHTLSEFVFGFQDKARQHRQSFINFSRLVKRIDNEYNNPVKEHKPYRQFIESISEDYDRYTEHALMIPDAVNNLHRERWLKSFVAQEELQQQQQEQQQQQQQQEQQQQQHSSSLYDSNSNVYNDVTQLHVESDKRHGKLAPGGAKKHAKHKERLVKPVNLDTAIDIPPAGANSAIHTLARQMETDPRIESRRPSLDFLSSQFAPTQQFQVNFDPTCNNEPLNEEMIERFRLRNQIRLQNRTSRRPTLNSASAAAVRNVGATFGTLSTAANDGNNYLTARRQTIDNYDAYEFDRRQQTLQRQRQPWRSPSNLQHLPVDSIIELSNLTSSDKSQYDLAQEQQSQPLGNQVAGGQQEVRRVKRRSRQQQERRKEKAAAAKQSSDNNGDDVDGKNTDNDDDDDVDALAAASCKTSVPAADTSNRDEQGDTPDELASVCSGVVRFAEKREPVNL